MYELPQFKYSSGVTLAKWVTGAFILYACADLYGIYFYLSEVDFVRTLAEGGYQYDYGSDFDADIDGFMAKADQVAAAILGFKVAVIITWCMWVHRVASNARSFDVPMSNSPGWAVGWYFIPIMNLWKPYGALTEVWAASDPSLKGDGDQWLQPARFVPWFFLTWWLTYLGAGFIDRFAAFKLESNTPEDWVSGMYYGALSLGVDLVAAGLAVTVCRTLTKRQEERANAGMPQATIVTEHASVQPPPSDS